MLYPVYMFLNIGTPELILILGVALLLFGGNKLPELARGLGKGIREFKDASDGVKREIHNQINSFDEVKIHQEQTNASTTSISDASPLDQPEITHHTNYSSDNLPHTNSVEETTLHHTTYSSDNLSHTNSGEVK